MQLLEEGEFVCSREVSIRAVREILRELEERLQSGAGQNEES